MRPPDPNRFVSYSTYFCALWCFLVGYAAVTVLSLGRVTQDERDGPGLSPVSRLPDGRIGLSEFAIDVVGTLVQVLAVALVIGAVLLWQRHR